MPFSLSPPSAALLGNRRYVMRLENSSHLCRYPIPQIAFLFRLRQVPFGVYLELHRNSCPLAFTLVTEPRKASNLSISNLARSRFSSAVLLTGSKTTLIPYEPLAIFYSERYTGARSLGELLYGGAQSPFWRLHIQPRGHEDIMRADTSVCPYG